MTFKIMVYTFYVKVHTLDPLATTWENYYITNNREIIICVLCMKQLELSLQELTDLYYH